MKNLSVLCLSLLLLFAVSCRDTARTTAPSGKELSKSETQLKTEMATLSDSLDANWQHMTESDERKLASIRRLLDEISYTPRYNSLRQRQLVQAHEQLKTMRYDRQTMSNSEVIDRYDAAQDSLVNGTLDLAANTPEVEKYPLIGQLAADIQEEHGKTIIFRIKHDTYGRDLNKLLESNERKVQKLGEPYASMKKVPLFSLSGT